MVKILRTLSVFSLTFVLTALVLADEKKPQDKKPEDKKPTDVKPPMVDFVANFFKMPAQIKLTDEQQKQLDKLKADYGSKIKEAVEKTQKIETPERIKAQQEAFQKALKEGKKGQELIKAVLEAMNLTEEEKKIMEARGKLFQEVNKKKMDILTEEQKKLFAPTPPRDKVQPKPADKN